MLIEIQCFDRSHISFNIDECILSQYVNYISNNWSERRCADGSTTIFITKFLEYNRLVPEYNHPAPEYNHPAPEYNHPALTAVAKTA